MQSTTWCKRSRAKDTAKGFSSLKRGTTAKTLING